MPEDDGYNEWLANYLKNSGMTEEELKAKRLIVRCGCGDPQCNGWSALPISKSDPEVRLLVEMSTRLSYETATEHAHA